MLKKKIKEIDFASWNEFKAGFARHLFKGSPFRRGRFLFRGHSDPNWTLSPTFDRKFGNIPESRRGRVAEQLLQVFKRETERFDIPDIARRNDDILLALGQHYGLPTRLLDWTESPYVAAFFAFNNTVLWGASDHRIVIWILDTKSPIWKPGSGVEIIDVPSFGNVRIRNQAGKFTLSKTSYACLEEYVKHKNIGGSEPLIRFNLPASDAMHALADLDVMGINHATVFPEMDGATQLAVFRTVLTHKTYLK